MRMIQDPQGRRLHRIAWAIAEDGGIPDTVTEELFLDDDDVMEIDLKIRNVIGQYLGRTPAFGRLRLVR